MSHTPGPWEAVKHIPASGSCHEVWTIYPPIPAGETKMGAVAECWFGEADARLIAAAPLLLEAAHTMLEHAARPMQYADEWENDCKRLEKAVRASHPKGTPVQPLGEEGP